MVMCRWKNPNNYSLRINGLQNPNIQTKGLRNGGLALHIKCGVIWHGKGVGGNQTEKTGSLIGGTSFPLAPMWLHQELVSILTFT